MRLVATDTGGAVVVTPPGPTTTGEAGEGLDGRRARKKARKPPTKTRTMTATIAPTTMPATPQPEPEPGEP